MRNYEVTFIVDPVLSGDEIKATAQAYKEQLESHGASITYMDEMGLRQLAYPINKRTSGVYYSIEVQVANGDFVSKVELAMRRDDRIMRFLFVRLDKFGVKYNDDKRNGKIGKKRSKPVSEDIVKTPVKPEVLKTQSKVSLAKNTVTSVAGAGEEEE